MQQRGLDLKSNYGLSKWTATATDIPLHLQRHADRLTHTFSCLLLFFKNNRWSDLSG